MPEPHKKKVTEITRPGGPTLEYPWRSFDVCGSTFMVDARYECLKPVGRGAYGIICAARDVKFAQKVAIKKIPNAFDRASEATRILREVKLLRHFRNHDNIVSLKDIMKPINLQDFVDVYWVTDLMETDLHQIIKSPQPLTDAHVQFFVYQILRGLKYIHSGNVLHRDLKPSNLLVNANCDLKICDFGLSRVAAPKDQGGDGFMTLYVTTRWYRAPEILLSCKEYTKAVDMWSVGCIFAELLGRRALFPGRDYMHQLQLIFDVVGTPSTEELELIESEKARRFVQALPAKKRCSFSRLYPNSSAPALALLKRMLVFDPRKRITVSEALADPYLAPLHDPTDEPECHEIFNFDFENERQTRDELRKLVYGEMLKFHPEAPEEEEARRQAASGTTSMDVESINIDKVTITK